MKILKKIWQVLLIVGIIAIFLFSLPVVIDTVIDARRPYSDFTTALDREIILDLCKKFELPTDDERCQEDGEVYAPQFFSEVCKFVRKGKLSSYTDWEALFGAYQMMCSSPVRLSDSTEYFTCNYDFNGDRIFRIGVFFFGDGSLWRIHYGGLDS